MKPDLKKLAEQLKAKGGNILVIQTAFLGDVVLVTPLLRAIKEEFPKCKLYIVVLPAFTDMVAPFVDEVIPFDKKKLNKSPELFEQLIELLTQRNIDIAFIPHRSLRSAFLAKRAKIPIRIGFNRGPGKWLHTHVTDYKYGDYEGSRNISQLLQLTSNEFSALPRFEFSDDIFLKINELIFNLNLSPDKFVVIAPGSVWKTKLWLKEYYIQLAKVLLNDYDLKTVVVGGKEDFDLGQGTTLQAEQNLCGLLTPIETACLMSKARVVISGDSAPAHLATAAGSKQVIIFGSTEPRFGFVAPSDKVRIVGLDLWCRPCTTHGRHQCPLKHFNCMHKVKHTEIIDTIIDWLQK